MIYEFFEWIYTIPTRALILLLYIYDESLLFCNCACSLEYSSLSTLAGLSYHICGKLEVAFKAFKDVYSRYFFDQLVGFY